MAHILLKVPDMVVASDRSGRLPALPPVWTLALDPTLPPWLAPHLHPFTPLSGLDLRSTLSSALSKDTQLGGSPVRPHPR